jgi:hypothetical protein
VAGSSPAMRSPTLAARKNADDEKWRRSGLSIPPPLAAINEPGIAGATESTRRGIDAPNGPPSKTS